MKRAVGIIFLIIYFFVFISFTVAEGQDASSRASERSANSAGKSLKVGLIIPLSGLLAKMGEAVRDGALFALDDLRRSKRLRISLMFEDGQYSGKGTLASFHKLLLKGAEVIIVWGNMPSEVSASLAEREGVTTLVATTNPVSGRHIIRFGQEFEKAVKPLVQKINELGSTKVGVVSLNLGNALKVVDKLRDEIKGKLKSVNFIEGEEDDFRSLIVKLKHLNIDLLVLFLGPARALSFLKQSAELHYRPVIIGGDIFADVKFRLRASKLGFNIYYLYAPVKDNFLKRAASRSISLRYPFEVATGYSLVLVANFLAKARNYDPDFVKGFLEKFPVSSLPIEGAAYHRMGAESFFSFPIRVFK
ncbi:MAG: hypothetical protein D6780_00585 [Candidatus Dadabacteria bacterium]|nr:MAG: hypothetical protein D6780_00585 [Candidatus Dadabacteria bacterium]